MACRRPPSRSWPPPPDFPLTHPAGVARNFAALGAGEVVARLIAFAALVYTAHVVGAAGYGIIAFAGAVMLYGTHMVEAGIETTGIAAVTRAPDRAGPLAGSLLVVRLAIAAGLVAVLIVIGLFVFPQPEGAILAAYACALPIRALTARWALIGLGKPAAASVARVAGEAVTTLIVLAMVRDAGDLGAVPFSQVAGDAAAALVMLAALGPAIRRASAGWRAGEATQVLRDSWPLLAHALLALVVFNGGLLLLRVFRDSAAVGVFAAAYALVSFLSNVGMSYGASVLPAISRPGIDAPAAGDIYVSSTFGALVLTVPVAAGGLVVSGGLMGLLYGESFLSGTLPLQVLLWTVPAVWVRFVAQSALVAGREQRAILRITVVAAILALILYVALIPPFGMLGAALATLITEVLRMVWTLAIASRAGYRLTGARRLPHAIAAVAVMLAGVLLLRGLPSMPLIAVGGLLYGVALAGLGVVEIRRGQWPVLRR